MDLTDRLALVTGSSRGIGEAIALALSALGARVVVNHLNSAADAARVVSAIRGYGREAWVHGFDVGSYESVSSALSEIESSHGPIDILINNAGIVRDRSFRKMTVLEWSEVINVNLNGVMNTCSAIVPGMAQRGLGRIVNISSFVAQAGNFGQTNYAAAKAGMIGFARSLSLEVATNGVTVNCVCPGFIETQMWTSIPESIRESILQRIPMKRVGHPDDVARAVVFLVQDGEYITGQTINVNGGVFIG